MPSVKEIIRRKMEKEAEIETEPEFKSTHGLDFMCAPYWDRNFVAFKVGTCHGLYCSDEKAFKILAIANDKQGNGHLQDVFDWFENVGLKCRFNALLARVSTSFFVRWTLKI